MANACSNTLRKADFYPLVAAGFLPGSDIFKRLLQVAERGDLQQFRFQDAKVPLATLSRVDAEGEDAKAIAECPALPDGVDRVVEVLHDVVIAGASIH
jgi:hypothetical protein